MSIYNQIRFGTEEILTNVYGPEVNFSAEWEDVPLQVGKTDIRMSRAPGMEVQIGATATSYSPITNLLGMVGSGKNLDISGFLGSPARYDTIFPNVYIIDLSYHRLRNGVHDYSISFAQDTRRQTIPVIKTFSDSPPGDLTANMISFGGYTLLANLNLLPLIRFAVDIDDQTLTNKSRAIRGANRDRIELPDTEFFSYPVKYVPFDTGSVAFVEDDEVTGETSGESGIIKDVTVVSGTWAGGTAAGWLTIIPTRNKVIFFPGTYTGATFQDNEHLHGAGTGTALVNGAKVDMNDEDGDGTPETLVLESDHYWIVQRFRNMQFQRRTLFISNKTYECCAITTFRVKKYPSGVFGMILGFKQGATV